MTRFVERRRTLNLSAIQYILGQLGTLVLNLSNTNGMEFMEYVGIEFIGVLWSLADYQSVVGQKRSVLTFVIY